MEKVLHETVTSSFLEDVISGLSAKSKFLQSKYFYDSLGDKLFQQIMNSPEYYLTSAELEIFRSRCAEMVECLQGFEDGFDVVELGAGDALKSRELLSCLYQDCNFTYFPIDISSDIIRYLEEELPDALPGLAINGIAADYFEGLRRVADISGKPKLVLFLGSNIGNMYPQEAENFLIELKTALSPQDLVLIGFDLKKNPWEIFHAYNDSQGLTEEFNLNLLKRINTELKGDFDLRSFKHYESYDPETGACKSYLISLKKQSVQVEDHIFQFEENEYIFMEISQKYSPEEIRILAASTGFVNIKELFDSKKRFVDVIFRQQAI